VADLDANDLADMDELARLGHGASPAATKDLVAEVRRLRALLARCVDHIDPNDSDDAYRLLVECEEASRG